MPVHNLSPFGAPLYSAGAMISSKLATLAALKALGTTDPTRREGNEVEVAADGSRWYFNSTSVLAGDDILVATPGDLPSAGRWLRAPGVQDISLPFTFATADAAALLTVPAGCRILVLRGYWEIAADMTGGASSAIGLSGSAAPHNTKGDLLGGAAGDVAATLVAGVKLGTVGADQAAGIMLFPTNAVRFDRITSAFTAGSGNAHLVVQILANPGA